MSYADNIFIKNCTDIITNGDYNKNELVRPVWADTKEKAYTIKKFGIVNEYDLSKEFPAITIRKTYIKSAFDELLWIWQKKSNNIKELRSNIWNAWADLNGSIGKAYGYQMGKKYLHHQHYGDKLEDFYKKKYPSIELVEKSGKNYIKLDQTDSVLWDLSNNPYSRRIITNMYNLEELHEMNLYPCAYSMTFNCTYDKKSCRTRLNGLLNQRSQDMLVANNWNVCQYALLIMMLAQCNDMAPGRLIHVIGDAHIYDRHVPIVEELIKRPTHSAPLVSLNPEIKNFYDFTAKDLTVEHYETEKQITNIPVAV